MRQIILSLVLTFALVFTGTAQNVDNIPLHFLSKSSNTALVRNGLTAGWDLRGFNLLRFSEDFSNAAWTRTNLVANGQLIESTATAQHALRQDFATVVDQVYSLTIRAKATGAQRFLSVWPQSAGLTGVRVEFNLVAGVISHGPAGTPTPTGSIVAVGDGWYDCTITYQAKAASTAHVWYVAKTATVYNESYEGDGESGFLVARAQLNSGTTPLPYIATGDLQSVPNMVPGGAALQRGSAAGADTNDPTPSAAGWVFDGVDDRVTTLPTKAATWTTINCSASFCYGIDSAGVGYVNGVPQTNLIRWSERLDNAAWGWTYQDGSGSMAYSPNSETAPDGTNTADKVTPPNSSFTFLRTTQYPTMVSGITYTLSVYAKPSGFDFVQLGLYGQTSGTCGATFNVATGQVGGTGAMGACAASTIQDAGGGWYRVSIRSTLVGTVFQCHVYVQDDDANDRAIVGDGVKGLLLWGAQLNSGSTPAAYQKTEDAREFPLTTAGGYSGILSWHSQHNRALNSGEHRRIYERYIKPRVNAVGGTLP